MSNPLNIYAANIDPAGVLEVLRRHGNVQVDGDDDNWTQATVTWKAGVFKKHKLVVGHSKEHYDGEDWQIQVRGMRGYFSQFGPSAAVDEALARLGGLKFTLAFPSNTFDLEKGDDKLPVVLAIAEHLDGILFTPGFLLDANFKVLVDPDGEAEEGAQWPASLPPVAFDDEEDEDEDEEYDPPDARRVLRRALVLAACCAKLWVFSTRTCLTTRQMPFASKSGTGSKRQASRMSSNKRNSTCSMTRSRRATKTGSMFGGASKGWPSWLGLSTSTSRLSTTSLLSLPRSTMRSASSTRRKASMSG